MYSSTAKQRQRSDVQALAEKLYRDRRTHLLRIAVRNASSEADAEEALQFAFLAFLEHFDPRGDAPPLAWLTLTLKRECWAKQKREHLDRRVGEGPEISSGLSGFCEELHSSGAPQTAERIAERLDARARLAQLKPAERQALGLIAAGYSYKEIGEICQWSYTKVNRCAAEGRAALRVP